MIEVGTPAERIKGDQKYYCLRHKKLIDPEWILDEDTLIPVCESCCMEDMDREGIEFGDIAEIVQAKEEPEEDALDGVISETVGDGLEQEEEGTVYGTN